MFALFGEDYIFRTSMRCAHNEGVAQGVVQGVVQGRINSLLETIKNVMQTTKKNCFETMELLGIPKNEQADFAEMLNSN